MALFDQLRYLTQYLHDAHIQKKHHLSQLYESVQYSQSIIPRLYLMITIGAAYMSVAYSPSNHGSDQLLTEAHDTNIEEELPFVNDLMKDMLEMSRGVQHPIRGLFLRYYLSAMTRDFLPDLRSSG